MCVTPNGVCASASRIKPPLLSTHSQRRNISSSLTSTISETSKVTEKRKSGSNNRGKSNSQKDIHKATSKTKVRKSKGAIANKRISAGPNLYLNKSLADEDGLSFEGLLIGKVVKAKKEILIRWVSNKTDKGENIDERYLRTEFQASTDRPNILKGVEQYEENHSRDLTTSGAKRKQSQSDTSSLSKKQKKETPIAVKANPMNVAINSRENSAMRSDRRDTWNVTLSQINSGIGADIMAEQREPGDDERRQQLNDFNLGQGIFAFDPDDVGGEEESDSDSDEFIENPSPVDAGCSALAVCGSFDDDDDDDDDANDDATRNIIEPDFLHYNFQDSIEDEFPDCDAEDYDEPGLDGIVAGMEDNGVLGSHGDVRLNFKFEDIPEGLNQTLENDVQDYKGKRLAPKASKLKEDIPDRTWKNALSCFFFVSGMGETFFDGIARKMTDYVVRILREKGASKFAGYNWKKGSKFTGEEVINCLRIVLKISLDGRVSGSYRQYFFKSHQSFSMGTNRTHTVESLEPWAKGIVTFQKFTQFLCAFRGEERSVPSVEDRGYQLRPFINELNRGALRTFMPGRHLAFDEGGASCRSRRCSIRQYNKDKPNKFRVDFFITAASDKHFIMHCDVYQGKKGGTINVDSRATIFPTTQRVLINALIKSKVANSQDGWRFVWCDSRYSAPLAFQFCLNLGVFCGGTIRKNRKGWDKNIMNLPKSSERGTSLVKYDKVHKQIAIQWNDNKVVSFLTTALEFEMANVTRRKGHEILKLKVPKPLKMYQQNMGGVDRGDQIRESSAGGFFKGIHKLGKWYKKIIFAVLDFACLNASIAWNMRADTDKDIKKCSYLHFQTALSQEMINFRSSTNHRGRSKGGEQSSSSESDDDVPSSKHIIKYPKKMSMWNDSSRCIVCRLEQDMRLQRGDGKPKKLPIKGRGPKTKNMLGYCEACNGAPTLHGDVCDDKLLPYMPMFGEFEDFKGKTCFEIFHSERCKGLWYKDVKYTKGRDGRRSVKHVEYHRRQTHEVYKKLQELYKIDNPKKGKRRSTPQAQNNRTNNDATNGTEESKEDPSSPSSSNSERGPVYL